MHAATVVLDCHFHKPCVGNDIHKQELHTLIVLLGMLDSRQELAAAAQHPAEVPAISLSVGPGMLLQQWHVNALQRLRDESLWPSIITPAGSAWYSCSTRDTCADSDHHESPRRALGWILVPLALAIPCCPSPDDGRRDIVTWMPDVLPLPPARCSRTRRHCHRTYSDVGARYHNILGEPARADRDPNVHETALCHRSMTACSPECLEVLACRGNHSFPRKSVTRAGPSYLRMPHPLRSMLSEL